jgi:L-aminopeptidase/D-esterase-like protein
VSAAAGAPSGAASGAAPGAPPAAPPAVDLAPFGLAIGHAADAEGATGCTVVRGDRRAVRAAHALLGRASGSRELAATAPEHLVGRADAVLLTGGSAYGLDAAAGVMRWMEERGRGFPVGDAAAGGVVPIVPAAVLFDLLPLGRFDRRPTPAMAYAACDAARPLAAEQGSVGAGAGLTVGKALGRAGAMKGGVGVADAWAGGVGVAAVAAVNAFGDVRDAAGRVLAGARGPGGRFAGETGTDDARGAPPNVTPASPFANTTLAVVAASRPLDRVALAQLARAAAAALYRRVTPCGTTFDGDVIFALCPDDPPPPDDAPADRLQLEVLAVRALEEAVERAVRFAVGRDGVPGLADPPPPA